MARLFNLCQTEFKRWGVLGLAALLAGCVITTGERIFATEDFASVDGLAGMWQSAANSDGGDEKQRLLITEISPKTYQALPVSEEDNQPGPDHDEPMVFSLVPLSGGDYILVSEANEEGGALTVSYLGLRMETDTITTFMFGGGSAQESEALRQAAADNELEYDPSYSYEMRLIGEVTPDALKSLFEDLMTAPETFGAYWVEYLPVKNG